MTFKYIYNVKFCSHCKMPGRNALAKKWKGNLRLPFASLHSA